MGGACSAYGVGERRGQGLLAKPEGKENTWGDSGVDGRIVFRWILPYKEQPELRPLSAFLILPGSSKT
jgi:hypothetical protein